MPSRTLVLAPEFYGAALDDSPYFRFYERSPVTRLLLDTIPRYIHPGASVLDLGCGNAIGACHLAAGGGQALTYLGIDPSAAACDWARKVLESLPPERVQGRVLTLTLQAYLASPPQTFDLILSSWAFRTCVDLRLRETHASTTVAMAERLAPQGALLVGDGFIASGATDDEIDRIHRAHERLVGNHGCGNPIFPPELIEALFTSAGLRRIEHHDVQALPLGQVLRIPHDRYRLQVFRHDRGET